MGQQAENREGPFAHLFELRGQRLSHGNNLLVLDVRAPVDVAAKDEIADAPAPLSRWDTRIGRGPPSHKNSVVRVRSNAAATLVLGACPIRQTVFVVGASVRGAPVGLGVGRSRSGCSIALVVD